MGKLVLSIGLIGLCHAAYSATQHKSYMRLTEHDLDSNSSPVSSLPLDILIQTIVCLFLSCFGVIQVAAKFRPIKITSEWEHKTWDNVANRTSFYSFNHRGKYLFSDSDNIEPNLDDYVKIQPKQNKSQRPVLVETKESDVSSVSSSEDYSSDEQTTKNS
ncbi:unnamed protein product [Brachionus calyciflorus]|uniref:Membrane magnesium transporter n=1 Tax=Brachionus calyciflorus TaxID=104777 RepID=A0A813YMI2_9BILA|nr:unnamed protein product [Brachionus calyciflorus]